MTNRILAASLLVALTTIPALAASTLPPTGGPTITIGGGGGEIDSPGDPFIPERIGRAKPRYVRPETAWYLQGDLDFACELIHTASSTDYFVDMINYSAVTVPAGTKIIMYLANNQPVVWTLEEDWLPGTHLKLPKLAPSPALYDMWNRGLVKCEHLKFETGYYGAEIPKRELVPTFDPDQL